MPAGQRSRRTVVVSAGLALMFVGVAAVLLVQRIRAPDEPSAQAPANVPVTQTRPGPDTTGPETSTNFQSSDEILADEPNQIIEGLVISGSVTVDAPGVVIRNSRISGAGPYGIRVLSGSATISDTEISGFDNGVAGDNWTGYRLNIHSMMDDGVKLGSNVTLQDSWIHDLTPSPDAHADGAQMQAGVRIYGPAQCHRPFDDPSSRISHICWRRPRTQLARTGDDS